MDVLNCQAGSEYYLYRFRITSDVTGKAKAFTPSDGASRNDNDNKNLGQEGFDYIDHFVVGTADRNTFDVGKDVGTAAWG